MRTNETCVECRGSLSSKNRTGRCKECNRIFIGKNNRGRKRPDNIERNKRSELREKSRIGNLGKRRSVESRERMKITNRGKGRPRSLQVREKLRIAALGRKATEEDRWKMSLSACARQDRPIYKKRTIPELRMRENLQRLCVQFFEQRRPVALNSEGYPIGPVDFWLPQFNLAIEVDGEYWHNYERFPAKKLSDERKNKAYAEAGIKLLRIPDSLILQGDVNFLL